MKSTTIHRIAAIGLAALAAALGSPGGVLAQTGTLSVQAGDRLMASAVEQARAKLPVFWKTLAHPAPGEERFAIKVPISDGTSTEHVWLTQIERRGDLISGRVNNKPVRVTSFELGQRVEVREADIADWLFLRKGKIVGNETLRVLFSRLPTDKAAYFRSLYEAD